VLATAFAALFFLAAVEASLAVLREYLVESEMTLRQALAGTQVSSEGLSVLPVAGQATLGFILPWILALLAVPLEMLLESGQHVAGRVGAGLLVLVGHLSRLLSHLVGYRPDPEPSLRQRMKSKLRNRQRWNRARGLLGLPLLLAGIHVAAVHVIKLERDNLEPAEYRGRLNDWKARVEAAGAASWRVILDPAQVPEYLESMR
jgi:hypothetical protein